MKILILAKFEQALRLKVARIMIYVLEGRGTCHGISKVGYGEGMVSTVEFDPI